jgi:putative solute:sodium symporter small subunit
MKKVDRAKADQYFKEKNRFMALYLVIWFISSFVMVFFAESLSSITINGFPFHYFMGAQGSILIFIILLYVNAIVADRIDRKYGIDESKNEQISYGKTLDH